MVLAIGLDNDMVLAIGLDTDMLRLRLVQRGSAGNDIYAAAVSSASFSLSLYISVYISVCMYRAIRAAAAVSSASFSVGRSNRTYVCVCSKLGTKLVISSSGRLQRHRLRRPLEPHPGVCSKLGTTNIHLILIYT
jgi:hypothetical protein